MSNKVTPVFLYLFLAVSLWTLGYSLSVYTATDGGKHGVRQDRQVASEDNGELSELRKKVQAAPTDVEASLQLARALEQQGFERENQSKLMEAVEAYTRVLSVQPKNEEALLGIANLCAQTGLLDKASSYFERYLSLRPDDLPSKSDYALTLVQMGDLKKGQEVINKIIAEDPKLFRARLVEILILRLSGNDELLKSKAKEAESLAISSADKVALEKVMTFKLETADEVSKKQTEDRAHVSPAEFVDSYFRNHQIVGQKLRSIVWREKDQVEIKVADFPVEQMPEFAKQKFISNVQAEFGKLGENFKVYLVDASSGKELLVIEVKPNA